MRASPIASPCTGVCRMDAASGWCLGCLRTIDEIAAWASLDDAARLRVLSMLRQRRQQRATDRSGPSAGNQAVS